MSNKITTLECTKRCFVYENGNSIPFSEIENEIKSRTRNIEIDVYEYIDEKNPLLEPIVFIQASYNGYKFRETIEKEEIGKDNPNGYYDYLAKHLAYAFGNKYFLKGLDEEWK